MIIICLQVLGANYINANEVHTSCSVLLMGFFSAATHSLLNDIFRFNENNSNQNYHDVALYLKAHQMKMKLYVVNIKPVTVVMTIPRIDYDGFVNTLDQCTIANVSDHLSCLCGCRPKC